MRVRSFFSVKKTEKDGKMISRKAQTAKSSEIDTESDFTDVIGSLRSSGS